MRDGQEKLVKATAKKALLSINLALNKAEDEDVKNKLTNLKEKIQEGLDKDYD